MIGLRIWNFHTLCSYMQLYVLHKRMHRNLKFQTRSFWGED